MGRPPRITRHQILEAARGGFAERGFEGTTLADVAVGLGVTPAAILRHFPSKQALFAAAMSPHDVEIPQRAAALATADPAADPRVVLRTFAEEIIPFIRSVVGSAIAVQMHMRSRAIVLPFDMASEDIPPRRALRLLTDYFTRAMDAGTVRRSDPRALALIFVGHLQSYVLLHDVLDVEPVYPLDLYLDALIALWAGGAIVGAADVEESRSGPARAGGRGRGATLRSKTPAAETAGPVRNRGGADRSGRVARRRPGSGRPRR